MTPAPPARPDDEILFHTALRGFAALMVVLYHAALSHKTSDLGLLSGLIRNGYVFVDVFFLLSGFILMRQYRDFFGQNPLGATRAFLLRRFLRIYPPYVVWLAVSVVMALVLRNDARGEVSAAGHVRAILAHLLMVQSIFETAPRYNVPLWSVAVEFVAYCLLPLLVLVLRPWRSAALAALALALFGGVWAFVAWYGTIDIITGAGSVQRALLGFTLGGVGCLLTLRHADLAGRAGRWLALPVVIAMLIAFGTGATLAGYGMALLAICLTSRNDTVLGRIAAARVPHRIGQISFSIYLCHVPVLTALILLTAKAEAMTGLPLFSNYVIFAALAVACSIAVALPSYHLIEVRLRAALSGRAVRNPPRRAI
jgi:peptidoglycan/LPS O-acetylase OafA/YrhL